MKARTPLLLSGMLASIGFLSWIAFDGKPAPRVSDTKRNPKTADIVPTSDGPSVAPSSPEPTEAATDTVELSPPLDLKDGSLAWEAVVEGVISSASSDSAKARQLLALLRALPEEALASTAATALQRLPDSAYPAAQSLLLDPDTHGQVLSALFADLLNRSDAIALPNLVAIAASPAHPFKASALDDLQLLLGKDHGTDWPKWEAEVSAALATQ